jgi:chemotaxis signal transduction protein
MELVGFSILDRLYGLHSRYVNRVIECTRLFPAPFMPECHKGLLFYRGDLYDVIDVGILFSRKASAKEPPYRIILLKWELKKLAIIPDVVIGLVSLDDPSVKQEASRVNGQPIDLITPDSLWDQLLKLSYGPGKIL